MISVCKPLAVNGPILTTAMRQLPSVLVYSGPPAPMNQNTDVIDLLDDALPYRREKWCKALLA